jgi:phosphate transport system substrate-binding protein
MKNRLVALAALIFLCGAASIRETGSTLLLPLMSLWVGAYERAHPDVTIAVEGTGSGEGIAQAMADAQLQSGVLDIPLAVSAQVVAYNVQEIGQAHLNVSGDVLAGIYSGTIAFWDDPKIRAMNSDVARDLPHSRIVPIRRIEGSGDTFLFTHYLAATTR